MQYVIYFAVTAPLVLGGLLWASANTPPQPPMFNGGYNAIADQVPEPVQTATTVAPHRVAGNKVAAEKVAAKKVDAIADNDGKSDKPAADKKS